MASERHDGLYSVVVAAAPTAREAVEALMESVNKQLEKGLSLVGGVSATFNPLTSEIVLAQAVQDYYYD